MAALLFLSGILIAFQLPLLPTVYWLGLLPVFLGLSFYLPKFRFIFIFFIGFLWVVVHGHIISLSELPDNLEGKDLNIVGVVSSMPEKNEKRTRFVLKVEQLSIEDVKQKQFPSKIRLNWYGKIASTVKAGERWQFTVRLKRPHGMLNPGSFDYEKWLFERKIRATGYVKKSPANIRINEAGWFSINSYRENLKHRISQLMPDSQYRGIVLALALGDRSEITDEQWKVFTATGTNHLVAISGLHIGLVAGAMFFIIGYAARRLPRLLLYLPSYKIAAFVAIVSAFFYAMLAGFAVPTQRALVMICVVMFFMMRSQRVSARTILSVALIVVLIVDPFSALSAGFWLSFIAVAAILYAMQSRTGASGLWWKWGRLQWIVTVALIPVLLFTFQTFSIISPVANVIAVPWVSFLVVPLVLLSVVFSFIAPVAELCLWLANYLLSLLWFIMDFFANLPFAQWQQFSPIGWTLIPGAIGVVLLLSPKGLPARYLAVFFLLPMFIIKPATPENGQFKFTLLDVGQGLSAVVQTQKHLLVFDTGPRFSSGFDTGEAVVLPFLRSIAVEQIDTMIISHGDNDHIGGMQSLLDNVKVIKLLTSTPEKVTARQTEICQAGHNWTWDGVLFEVLNPVSVKEYGKSRKSGNNRSCVLRVSTGTRSVLLTGDIEKRAEKKLLTRYPEKLISNILVAPHHGSNTSSSAAFIKQINPDYVLYPAGYRNRFGFPKPKVSARYKQQQVKEATTAKTGAISFIVDLDTLSGPHFHRDAVKRLWHQ